jgi:hypothetical protein
MTTPSIRVFARLVAQGTAFSPGDAERALGVHFSRKEEPGEIGTSGKFAGRSIPYGSGIIEYEANESDDELIPAHGWILGNPTLVSELGSRGATEINLYIDVEYEAQCNFELSTELLASLSKLGVTVGFSCFRREGKP